MTLALPTIAAGVLCSNGFSFGKTLVKLEKMIQDPLCSVPLLASVLSSDPVLTARVLGRANAGRSQEQATIRGLGAAITHLGLAAIQGLVRDTPSCQADRRRPLAALWANANATGLMARVLLHFCRQGMKEKYDPELVQLCGLLHAMGDIVAFSCFPAEYARACKLLRDRACTWQQALQTSLGLHGGGVGMLLAASWHLPGEMATVIRFHETPDKAKDDRELVHLIHLASHLVHACGFMPPGREFIEAMQDVSLDELGLRITDLEGSIRCFFDDRDEMEVYEGILAP